ncbi:MAG TPA: LLM class flavin-dependent oxidoreductase [Actinomycetota bacterium]|nr:LLM class flavin-dependent oxidoreductase [Actinomycetota bacterium]
MPRFGVSIVPSASGRSDPVAEAQRCEELGFDLLSIWDHPHGERPSFETWTLLTWIAARTSRVTLATNVLGLPFRLPALTAKMAESLDRLSNGRLILGLGGGGSNEEFAGLGAPVRTPAEKIRALEEALAVIRGVWTESPFTFEARHYRNDAALVEPKPEHPIPIWLGTYGPKALALTGRVADGWIPSLGPATPSEAATKMRAVRAAAEGAGRDPDALDYAFNVSVRIGGPPPDDPERRVAGDPDEVIERLLELLEIGFTVLNFWIGGPREEQAERLATQIIPALRGLG